MSVTTLFNFFKVKQGWRPGAVTKRLLRKLNHAKQRPSVVQDIKQIKRTKRRIEDKPTLIVTKLNGQYRVEMQAVSNNAADTYQHSPLIYTIESANNNGKLRKRLRLKERLVRAAVKEVWSEPYNPEACETSCYLAYKQAVGLPLDRDLYGEHFEKPEHVTLDFERNDDSCSCEDEEVVSSCSSSEVDWEIHFTPPVLSHKALQKTLH